MLELETGRPAATLPRGDAIVLPYLVILAERWRFVVALPLLAALLALGVTMVIPSRFTASATILPEQRAPAGGNLAGLAGIATQLGVGLSSGAQSPQLFADLLQSREVLTRVLRSRVAIGAGSDSSTVLALLVPSAAGERERLERGVKKLRSLIATRVDARTGLIGLDVSMPSGPAAAGVAGRFLAILEDFNSQTRRSQASEKRKFAERRLHEIEDSLMQAENRARRFLEGNRQYRESPSLTFEFDRLQRQVSVYQGLYSELRGQYESSRISEVNDTPVFSIIDQPVIPANRSSPSVVTAVLVALVLGVIVAGGIVLFRHSLSEMRADDPSAFQRMAAAFSSVGARAEDAVRDRRAAE
jgi:uncharacterized protein involved in exopolysaccharide biosynthesis